MVLVRFGTCFQTFAALIQRAIFRKFIGARLARRRNQKFLTSHFAHIVKLAATDKRANYPAFSGNQPFISFVVPLYNSKPQQLDDLLNSFQRQPGPHCQLALSDDGSTSMETLRWLDAHRNDDRIVVIKSAQNRGIAAATNAGIAAAAGQWIGLLDHDDVLAPYAVARIADALAEAPNCKFLYTDELIVDSNLNPIDYFLKPAWDPVLLSGVNYINHLSLYRRDLLLDEGGLRDGFDGSQDYELVLRYTRKLGRKDILHLPYPAYLWRRHNVSFSTKFLQRATLNARKALGEAFGQKGRGARVDSALSSDLHRVRLDLSHATWPLVSVIIPSRNSLPLISKVLEGLMTTTDYPSLEIIVIDNGTTDPEVLALYEQYCSGRVAFRVEIENEPFNFSRSINKGISLARGEHVLILNNDVECLEPNWLKEMVSCFDYTQVGIVGAKLIYPNGTLQHAGVIAGLGGFAGHWFIGKPDDFPGPIGRLRVRQSFSVVTGACMLVSRACLQAVGTFDDKTFPIAYNDVDFCLRAVNAGFCIVWSPFAKLVHHESATRGSDETPENFLRFKQDKQSLRERHRTDEIQDRAFNPWYSRNRSDPSPVFLQNLPKSR